MGCLFCRSPRVVILYPAVRDHYGIAGGTYDFLRCEECGSATLDPLPAPDTLAALYTPDYTFKPDETPRAGLRAVLGALEWRLFYGRGYRRRLEIFRRLTGLTAGRVLEVGCGSGLFLDCLRRAGYEVEGIEMSKTDVEYARARLGLPVLHGTLETQPLEDDRYDAVLMIYVLEHIPNPHEILARVFRLLKPGGWALLGLPVMDSGQARLLGARWSAVTEAPRHVAIPSVAGARRLLEAAGFREIRSAPSPLIENAGHIALSLLPGAATPCSCGRPGLARELLYRCAGALCMLPGLLLAYAERFPGGERARAGTMFFCGRK